MKTWHAVVAFFAIPLLAAQIPYKGPLVRLLDR